MSKYKLIHEREICIGCAACESIAPKFWKMDNDEMKADLIDSDKVGANEERFVDDLEDNMEAAESCPVECIHIEEDGVRKI